MQTPLWHIKPCDESFVTALIKKTGLSPLIARLLVLRGISVPEQVEEFLTPSLARMPDPSLLADCDQAVDRLVRALTNHERICIYGDYDVDGISGTALLVEGLSTMGFTVTYHIPHRVDDGYGLNRDALSGIAKEGHSLAVTVDCGVTSCDEINHASAIGLDVIITDHHQPKEQLPAAVAVVDPHRTDCVFPEKTLSGVGVAFMLLVAVRRRLREINHPFFSDYDLRALLDLVALGTIADLVPMVGLNRSLVYVGLQLMHRTPRPGIKALCDVARVNERVTAGIIGYQIAPRLNASGRLESAVPGVELLLSRDLRTCKSFAEQLDRYNLERRSLERHIFHEAKQMVADAPPPGIVLSASHWHQGVVGIVASRMVERFFRPTVLLAELPDGSVKGSGRGIPGVDLLAALDQCSHHLIRYGGHRVAAGLTLHKKNLPAFKEQFIAAIALQLDGYTPQPIIAVDAEITHDSLSASLLDDLDGLAPYGQSNPLPILMLKHVTLRNIREFGEGHLAASFVAPDGTRVAVVGWGMAERLVPQYVDLVGTISRDRYRGERELRFEIKDFRMSGRDNVHAAL